MEKFRRWVREHPIAWVVGVFVIAVILGAVAGSASESTVKDEKADLEERISEIGESLDASKGAQEEAEAEAEEVDDQRQQIIATAEGKARRIVGKAKREAEELSDVKSEIVSAEGELADIQDSLIGAEKEESLSSFGGGIMKGEVDYTVGGTYETAGGEGCYWAMLNSANTNDIATNEFTGESGQQIVTIETPYFTSSYCGTWKRVE